MSSAQLYAHLETGATTVCRAWSLTRADGMVLGFTDHDQDLVFDAISFKAETGLTARSLQQHTGLSVDNSEAIGGFSDEAITEEDLTAGRYDSAQVKAWLVNWAAVEERVLQFSGHIGDVSHSDGRFTAELRSLSDRLNQPRGRAYHRACSAVLGDGQCRFNMATPNYSASLPLLAYDSLGRMVFDQLTAVAAGWFGRGKLTVQSGTASGLSAVIKLDKVIDDQRVIEFLRLFGLMPSVGDMILLQAGCDKLSATCQTKFGNFLNFRGFPHIPGEDWLMSYPISSQNNDGGVCSVNRGPIILEARSWIGTPYLHQASVKGAGADCLGLVRSIWRALHSGEPEVIPAYTADWAEPAKDEALWRAARRWLHEHDRADERVGDVLLFRMARGVVAKHLGVQTSLGEARSFIHAYSGHGVVETRLSLPWQTRVVARFSFP